MAGFKNRFGALAFSDSESESDSVFSQHNPIPASPVSPILKPRAKEKALDTLEPENELKKNPKSINIAVKIANPKSKSCKKRVGNNRFVAFCYSDSDSDGECGTDDEGSIPEKGDERVFASPVLPKHPQSIQLIAKRAQVYAVLAVESSVKPRDFPSYKKFTPEIVKFDCKLLAEGGETESFSFVVKPQLHRVISSETIGQTGVSQREVDSRLAQPIDEVIRQFDAFLKKHSCVSVNAAKAKARNVKQKGFDDDVRRDRDLTACADADDIAAFREELRVKGIREPAWVKKFVDVDIAFAAAYSCDPSGSHLDFFQKICLQPKYESNGRLMRFENLCSLTSIMLRDGLEFKAQ